MRMSTTVIIFIVKQVSQYSGNDDKMAFVPHLEAESSIK